jgi:hypothetical protein
VVISPSNGLRPGPAERARRAQRDPDRFPVQRRVHAAAEPGGGFEAGLDIVLRGIQGLTE